MLVSGSYRPMLVSGRVSPLQKQLLFTKERRWRCDHDSLAPALAIRHPAFEMAKKVVIQINRIWPNGILFYQPGFP